MKNVINDSKIVIDQQSAKVVYYHVRQTSLSMAVILSAGTSKRDTLDISKKEYSCRFYHEELITLDIPSNSLPPLEAIQNIIVQIFILLNV